MIKSTKKAFTLVELIVVVTILAILGTIAFISLQGYSAEARDSKRVADVRALISKVTIENTRNATDFAEFLSGGVVRTATVTLVGNGGQTPSQGTINFTVLKESGTNFRDPGKPNSDYVYSVASGSVSGKEYNFFQFGTVNEVEDKAVLLGNVYQSDTSNDSNTIITNTNGSQAYIKNGDTLSDSNVLYPYR